MKPVSHKMLATRVLPHGDHKFCKADTATKMLRRNARNFTIKAPHGSIFFYMAAATLHALNSMPYGNTRPCLKLSLFRSLQGQRGPRQLEAGGSSQLAVARIFFWWFHQRAKIHKIARKKRTIFSGNVNVSVFHRNMIQIFDTAI